MSVFSDNRDDWAAMDCGSQNRTIKYAPKSSFDLEAFLNRVLADELKRANADRVALWGNNA
jgi:hypothetical protein